MSGPAGRPVLPLPRPVRGAWWPAVIALAGALLAGCGGDSATSSLFTASLYGEVVPRLFETDVAGNLVAVRGLDGVDGIPVDLLSDGGVFASTRTRAGRYQFGAVPRGRYRVVARVSGTVADTSAETEAGRVPQPVDTLRLGGSDSLIAYPNPMGSSASARIAIAVAASGRVDLTLLDLGGRRVRTLSSRTMTPGQYQFLWDGTDDAGAQVPSGNYWVVLHEEPVWRAQLLIR